MQRDNENVPQVQKNLEKEVTGGVSAYAQIRTVLSFVAVAYDLMRRLPVHDLKFMSTSENGKVILRFAASIQKVLKDDGLYLWRDLDLGVEAQELTLARVPAQILDQIRVEAYDEFMEKLSDGDIDIPDHIIVPLRERVKEDYLSDACAAACEAANDALYPLDGFDPFEVDNRLGRAAQSFEELKQNFEAMKEYVEHEFGVLEENIFDVENHVVDAREYVPSDGIDFSDIATDVGVEIEKAIERM